MNIQKIDIIDGDNIVITKTNGKTIHFEKKKLKGPKNTWYENIIACADSLVNYNPPK